MFERFSEKARRVIFIARRQASVFGTEKITPELLLLGMLEENVQEVCRLIGCATDACEDLRKKTEESIPRGDPVSLSEDMRVSKELGRVFRYAVQEITGLSLETVQLGHLLIGILHEEGCKAAELLRVNGAELKLVRQRMADGPGFN
jgi:ATP-dependent Clp protease ATP-binding subunit ClpC